MTGPEDGVSRCECGCKYWDEDRCVDCGDRWQGDCPAGGQHVWAEQDSGDAYGPIGGGRGTRVRRWIACDECGAQP